MSNPLSAAVGVILMVVLAILVVVAIVSPIIGIFVVAAFLLDGLLGFYPTMKDVVLALFVLILLGGVGGTTT